MMLVLNKFVPPALSRLTTGRLLKKVNKPKICQYQQKSEIKRGTGKNKTMLNAVDFRWYKIY